MSEEIYAHFIGIGGAGMSALALVLKERGLRVTGSDLKESRYSRSLREHGIPVVIGHDASNLGDPEVVVTSTAIPQSNPEVVAAQERGIPVWPRARMLAHLAGPRKTIAVAGTHGKTTTSSMIAVMLGGMGLDPTFLIGGEIDGLATNASNGAGEHFVVEADESDGSFVFLDPFVSLVTNIEADHMDHYASMAEVEQAFLDFMNRTDPDGTIIVCGDDPRAVGLARQSGRKVLTYGAGEQCDVRYGDVSRKGIGSQFEAVAGGVESAQCEVAVPGIHMVSNACGALACANALGLDMRRASDALSGFSGVRRRFDHVGEVSGITVVDDYAHHPTEIAATLAGAAALGFERVVALFQPHRYSRTAAFAAEFGQAFDHADMVALMDVYSAGESPMPGISGKTVLDAVLLHSPRTRAAYLPHRSDVVSYLADRLRPGDLVLTMGAGDVTGIGPELVRELELRGGAVS